MRVPVKIEIDQETKEFSVTVGTPTTSALIAKEAKIPKGSSKPNTDFVGNLSISQVISIAKAKMQDSYAKTLKAAVKEVIGSCVSMGVKIEGMDPREFTKEIEAGKYDEMLK
jgi:large subunit ribosomal protein L11